MINTIPLFVPVHERDDIPKLPLDEAKLTDENRLLDRGRGQHEIRDLTRPRPRDPDLPRRVCDLAGDGGD
ncbi:MAG: hypothetical protein HYR85_19980 [Planctomycetes bacterium]|nr:hypothetical protein [Planctomycetota bacterium]MBI3844509.1 hypothetical protein [Planctomycetota bacterium]